MTKLEPINSTLPNIRNRTERDFIPIRSITYKKNSVDNKSAAQIKGGRSSLSEIPYYFRSRNSNDQEKQDPVNLANTHRDYALSHISIQAHKLNFGKKPKVMTARSSPSTAATRSLGKLKVQSQMGYRSSSQINSTEHQDYFDILRDENRKPFQHTDFEGVDDYTHEHVMARIHSQGFRDAAYYSKAVNFSRLEIPDEKVIKDNYMLKISPWVQPMENEKTIVSHVLGGTVNNYTYVESVLTTARETLEETKRKKIELKEEIDTLNKNFVKELENIMSDYSSKMGKIDHIIQDDYISKQTEGFRLQKEITILKRDKMNLEKKIAETVDKLNKLEDCLYGKKIFQLEAAQKELDNIADMNLRSERVALMKNSEFIH